MSEIKNLLFLEIRSFYGINKFLHTKDPKFKNRYRVLAVAWVVIIAMVFTYVGSLSYGLCNLGLADIVPAYLTVISSVMIIFFGMFSVGSRIFTQKGYDILASMPVKSGSIVLSRFLSHYFADLVLTLVVMLPGIVIYGKSQKPDLIFYLLFAVGVLFVPAIPLVIATLFGTIVTAISSRMKNKSMAQSLISVVIVVGIIILSFSMDNATTDITKEQLFNIATVIGSVFGKIYPPAMWLNLGMIDLDISRLLLFIGISVLGMTITIFIVAKNFNSIVRRMSDFAARHNYKIGEMENRGITKSLYIREAKRYFSSSIYVTNTIIGPVLATIMSLVLCFVGIEEFEKSITFLDVPSVLPFVFSAVFCMMTTTSVSISMEGNQFWVVKSLPIPTKAFLDSKILLNLTLMAPFYLVSQIAFVFALRPDFLELLWLIVIPVCFILFVTVFGITVNLKFHSFDWEQEATVVKQSLSSVLGGFSGLLFSVLAGGLVFIIPLQFANLVKLVVCFTLLIITALLYKNNNKKNLINL